MSRTPKWLLVPWSQNPLDLTFACCATANKIARSFRSNLWFSHHKWLVVIGCISQIRIRHPRFSLYSPEKEQKKQKLCKTVSSTNWNRTRQIHRVGRLYGKVPLRSLENRKHDRRRSRLNPYLYSLITSESFALSKTDDPDDRLSFTVSSLPSV